MDSFKAYTNTILLAMPEHKTILNLYIQELKAEKHLTNLYRIRLLDLAIKDLND